MHGLPGMPDLLLGPIDGSWGVFSTRMFLFHAYMFSTRAPAWGPIQRVPSTSPHVVSATCLDHQRLHFRLEMRRSWGLRPEQGNAHVAEVTV